MPRTVRHTRTITQELRPPYQYVLAGMGLAVLLEVGGVAVLWLLGTLGF